MVTHRRASVGLAAALLLVCIARSAYAEPPYPSNTFGPPGVGTIVDRSNLDLYAKYLPAALKFAIADGLRAAVVPTTRVDWPHRFRQLTEKYSGQVRLVDENEAHNYIAGLPFPLIDVNDPNAAMKIAYNWHWGPFVPDDVMLFSSNRSQAYAVNAEKNSLTPRDDADDFRSEGPCNTLVFIRYAHRSKVEPIPRIAAEIPFEWRVRGMKCGRSRDYSIAWSELEDPDEWDVSGSSVGYISWGDALWWIFGGGSSSFFGPVYASDQCTYGCTQFWWEYVSPPPMAYKFRLLGVRPVLACLHAETNPAGIISSGLWTKLGKEKFELRSAYVLDVVPIQDRLSSRLGLISIRPLRARIYIDTETFVLLGYDLEHRESKDSAVPLWSVRTMPNGGGNEMELANEFFVPGDRSDLLLTMRLDPGTQKLNTGVIDNALFGR